MAQEHKGWCSYILLECSSCHTKLMMQNFCIHWVFIVIVNFALFIQPSQYPHSCPSLLLCFLFPQNKFQLKKVCASVFPISGWYVCSLRTWFKSKMIEVVGLPCPDELYWWRENVFHFPPFVSFVCLWLSN